MAINSELKGTDQLDTVYWELVPVPTAPRAQAQTQLLSGETAISPGYPRDWTPQDFDAWSADVDHIHGVLASDPSGRTLQSSLDSNPQLNMTHRMLFAERSDGIRGSLTKDNAGREVIILENGCHRAHYQMERGYGVTPVWVSSTDRAQLSRFSESCHQAVANSTPELSDAYRKMSDAREPSRSPEWRPNPEQLEHSRERGSGRRER